MFTEVVRQTPAVHRYRGSVAKRSADVLGDYGGYVARLWADRDPNDLEAFRRPNKVRGFGDQKAKFFLALLDKKCDVKAPRRLDTAGEYGEEGPAARRRRRRRGRAPSEPRDQARHECGHS